MNKDRSKRFSEIHAQVDAMPPGEGVQFVIGLAAYTLTRYGMTPDKAVFLLHSSRLTVGPEGTETQRENRPVDHG